MGENQVESGWSKFGHFIGALVATLGDWIGEIFDFVGLGKALPILAKKDAWGKAGLFNVFQDVIFAVLAGVWLAFSPGPKDNTLLLFGIVGFLFLVSSVIVCVEILRG